MQIPSLDGIRALSFLTVFLAHAGLGRWVPGYFGLSLFFFLSGYLITTLLRLEYDRTQTISLRQFYLRRVLRIFPPFYLVLLCAAAVTAAGLNDGSVQAAAFGAQLGHFTNYYIVGHGWWTGMPPGTWVYWSLAVEEHFYLVFPLLYLLLRGRGLTGRQIAITLGSICALFLAWRCILVFGFDAPKDRTYVATDTRVDSILFGCILAAYGNPMLDRYNSEKRLLWFWFPLGCFALFASIVFQAHWFDQTFRYTIQGIALTPLFAAAILFHDRWPFRMLSVAPLRRLGLLSYSLYLLHTAALYQMQFSTRWPEAVRSAATLVLIIVLAELLYRYVERPAGKLRRRLSVYLDPNPMEGPNVAAPIDATRNS